MKPRNLAGIRTSREDFMKPLTTTELTAAQDPTHPQHHFAWGQFLGVALFGLAAFESGPSVYGNPAFLAQFIGGISSVFHPKATP
jgi:hypothetical protein